MFVLRHRRWGDDRLIDVSVHWSGLDRLEVACIGWRYVASIFTGDVEVLARARTYKARRPQTLRPINSEGSQWRQYRHHGAVEYAFIGKARLQSTRRGANC